jgi:hypothetical protein
MDEETIYSDQEISISTSRIVIRGTTYALRNISSVKMTVEPAKTGCAIALIIGGVVWAIGIMGSKGGVAPALFLGGILIVGGVVWLTAAKAEYYVTIVNNAGEVRAHKSKNKQYIDKIVEAINEAMVRQR